MAIGIGSSWSEDSDDDDGGMFRHWKEDEDYYEPTIKHFRDDNKKTIEDRYEPTIKHFQD